MADNLYDEVVAFLKEIKSYDDSLYRTLEGIVHGTFHEDPDIDSLFQENNQMGDTFKLYMSRHNSTLREVMDDISEEKRQNEERKRFRPVAGGGGVWGGSGRSWPNSTRSQDNPRAIIKGPQI